MMENWQTTPILYALAGGLFIGVAATLLILINGRIAGISGILGGLLQPTRGNIAWRVCFLLGLVISPILYSLTLPLPVVEIAANDWRILLAGLMVGIGTRFSAGCTSGHGVCGIGRLSIRSIMATITFIATGMLTVYFTQHYLT